MPMDIETLVDHGRFDRDRFRLLTKAKPSIDRLELYKVDDPVSQQEVSQQRRSRFLGVPGHPSRSPGVCRNTSCINKLDT